MHNKNNLPYAVVCGGANIDIGAHSFAPLRDRDSNPGRVELSLGGVGRNIAHNMRLLGVPTYLLTARAAAAVPAAALSASVLPERNDQTSDAIIASPAPVALRISALQMGAACTSPRCAASTPSPPRERNTRPTPWSSSACAA